MHTDGVLYANGEQIGHTLEDVGRPYGVKIPLETCIPEGVYKARVTYSNKFRRDMVVLFNIDNDHSINSQGIRFTGIRVHGGNNTEHTAGCILAAKNSDKRGSLFNSIEANVTELVKNSDNCYFVISQAVE